MGGRLMYMAGPTRLDAAGGCDDRIVRVAKRAAQSRFAGDGATRSVTADDHENAARWAAWRDMAGPTRLELATSGVTGRRSNRLNYDPA
jgi:hypothetical protein